MLYISSISGTKNDVSSVHAQGFCYIKVSLYNYNKMLVVKFINNINALEIFTGNSAVKYF